MPARAQTRSLQSQVRDFHFGPIARASTFGERAWFEEWFDRALSLDAIVKAVDVNVPTEPDRERVEAWCVQAHLRAWGHIRVVVDKFYSM